MKTQAFGLDIGATSMKMVWLEEQKKTFVLRSAHVNPTPPKGMLSESPVDQEAIAAAIRQAVIEAQITTVYVNVAMPENQVYTRVIEMPLLSDKELASAIYWEAEQYIPMPLANVTLDWKVLRLPQHTATQTSKMEVLLVGAPTTLIDKYDKIISMAGLTLMAIETETIAVIRALTYRPGVTVGNQGTYPNTLIIHIGAMNTSLSIIKDGVLIFTYAFATGGNAISRSIASDFGFSVSQAEEYKKTYGVTGGSLSGKIGQATMPILTAIANEAKKATAFYSEKFKTEASLQQIILSGGSAKLPGIDLFFAQTCGIETITANPWHILSSQQVPKAILDSASDYTVAVGLAMRDNE